MSHVCGEDVAPWLVGALPPDEARRFEDHLAGCELCQGDVARLRPVVEALPVTPDAVDPPPELRERIMAEVRASAPRPERAARWWEWPRLRPLPALAAACILLVAGLSAGIALDGGSDGRTVTGTVAAAGAAAELDLRGDDGTLRVRGLPRAPRDRVWQVWLLHDGEQAPRPTDALFDVDRDGSASVGVPGDLRTVRRVLVTHEPAGGSTEPTVQPTITIPL